MSRRTVIAGWGYVGASGAGADAARAVFERGELPLTEVDRSGGYHRDVPAGRGSRHAALVPKDAFDGLIPPRKLRRMSPPSRFAVAATKQATAPWVEGGGDGESPEEPPPSTAVVSSTGFGPSSYTEELLRQIFLDQPTSASPFLFTEAVANAPAAQAALEMKATGPNITITQREVGPILAMGRARRLLGLGRVDRALVVAVDEVNPLLHAALDRFGALAGSRGGDEIARPFDRRRRGPVLAEGAAAVALESESEARRRGVKGPLWCLRAHVGGFDPSAPMTGWGRQPDAVAAAVRDELARQGVGLGEIDAVVCGAAGSVGGDRAEAEVLRALFPDAMPPVVAPKALDGEHGGALLAGAMWLLEGGRFRSPRGFGEADPDCGVVPFGDGALDPRRVLVGALAVGGAAAWMMLERIKD
ncbi:MAG: beta-ketoacyl synthase N-terminal-like domain-containing protein [Acidobacteriota bacterium]